MNSQNGKLGWTLHVPTESRHWATTKRYRPYPIVFVRHASLHSCYGNATSVYCNDCLKYLFYIRFLYDRRSLSSRFPRKIKNSSVFIAAVHETFSFFHTAPYKIGNTDGTHSSTHQQPCISAHTVRAALRRCCCCCRRHRRVRMKTRRWRSRFPGVRVRDPGASSIPAKTGWEIRFVERPCPRLLSAYAVRPANTIVNKWNRPTIKKVFLKYNQWLLYFFYCANYG